MGPVRPMKLTFMLGGPVLRPFRVLNLAGRKRQRGYWREKRTASRSGGTNGPTGSRSGIMRCIRRTA